MEPPADRDIQLLQGCRAGDASAWEALLQAYERLVFSIPLNYGLSRDEAADVTQLTFTALLESLDSLSDDSRLGAWLATVARRQTWRVLERGRRERPDAEVPIPESATLLGHSSRDPLERWELLEWLHRGLAHLNERCRELLQALYFAPDEPPYAEVALRLGIPVGSIGPTRARCLERLRQVLSEGEA
ncbi:MAG: sigma-70 family RNA polymerase sigma factor [Chloroflexaceae bacterium]|jgi:RNA polymerase sigma factor (sigma-70 family)|nr:sigma-70 family RNA polymerase sigma factor [Chloroflexaceae bacterium]